VGMAGVGSAEGHQDMAREQLTARAHNALAPCASATGCTLPSAGRQGEPKILCITDSASLQRDASVLCDIIDKHLCANAWPPLGRTRFMSWALWWHTR
jgi:hypothetical protein